MSKRVGVEVSIALGDAVKMVNPDVIAAYPITPQTHIVEHLAELVAQGELDAEYVPVESEHSAMSACLGSAAAGARTFTATAGQGLELMHEVLYVASGMRLPIVMAVVNRALSAPLSVWGDHSDAMAVRDTGWIQIFTENGQEVVDQTICAFKIAEHHDVLFPVMVHLDGFHLSHVIEPIEMPDEKKVCEYLPANTNPFTLHPSKPIAMGDFAPPVVFTEAKWAQEKAMLGVKKVINEIWDEFAVKFGRTYKPVECYKCEGVKNVLVTMGSYSETAMTAVDNLREKGEDIGLIRIRLWRPFPFEELRAVLKGVENVIVLDRSISPGASGTVASEIKSAMYTEKEKPTVKSYIGGLGGRDITVEGFEDLIKDGISDRNEYNGIEFQMVGVRE
ncbi:pyruvate flavodoxin/ferredoxin oxidoreductase domain protein [Dehalogenimonas lykanthroporepellens BL-DC-9]|nr:pyruvate flavodoxin/ferredoxin oxidoreductase domain protein [Dehalogenimonas lykanthroporepellens BL-DC-9]